jgi:hypothetical protein
VHQGAGIQHGVATPVAQPRARQLLQSRISGGKQRIARLRIACLGLPQQLGEIRHWRNLSAGHVGFSQPMVSC